jgi:hypothetical protein
MYSSWRHTKLKPNQEKKRYEELDDGRALEAASDTRDRAGRPYESVV